MSGNWKQETEFFTIILTNIQEKKITIPWQTKILKVTITLSILSKKWLTSVNIDNGYNSYVVTVWAGKLVCSLGQYLLQSY